MCGQRHSWSEIASLEAVSERNIARIAAKLAAGQSLKHGKGAGRPSTVVQHTTERILGLFQLILSLSLRERFAFKTKHPASTMVFRAVGSDGQKMPLVFLDNVRLDSPGYIKF